MQAMIHTMKGRRQYDTDISDENDPAKQSIKGREKLSRNSIDLYYRTHATQYHRGIVDGIQPICFCCIMIAEDADKQTSSKNKKCQHDIF